MNGSLQSSGMVCIHSLFLFALRILLKPLSNLSALVTERKLLKQIWSETVYSHFHWALVAAQRAGPQQLNTWRRYDSLSKEHEESHPQQILMGELLDHDFLTFSNIATQPVGSNASGCYMLQPEQRLEHGLRLFRGEWPSVWPEKSWKLRLVTVVPQLVVEANAVTEAAKLSHDKLESQKAKKN